MKPLWYVIGVILLVIANVIGAPPIFYFLVVGGCIVGGVYMAYVEKNSAKNEEGKKDEEK